MKESLQHPIFNVISEIAGEQQIEVFVIGGFVRDLLLQRTSKDADIVVLGDGIELAHEVKDILKNVIFLFQKLRNCTIKNTGLDI